MKLVLDPSSLTLGDLEDFEEYVGKTIDDVIKPVPLLGDDGNKVFDAKGRPEMTMKVPTKAVTCLVWLVNRRTDSAFTIEDARNVRIETLVLSETPEDEQGND